LVIINLISECHNAGAQMNKKLLRPIIFWIIVLVIIAFLRPLIFFANGGKTNIILTLLIIVFPLILLYIFILARRLFLFEVETRLNKDKAVAEKLRHSEEILRTSQKIAKIGCWEKFLISEEINLSDELFDIFDMAQSERNTDYSTLLDQLHEDENDTFRIKREEFYNCSSVEWEHKFVTVKGETKYLFERMSLIKTNGKPYKIIGVVQDITVQKQAEIKIIQSHNYYKSLFDSAKDGIILFHPNNGVIFDVNQKACEMFGYSKDEFVGISITSISKYPEQEKERINNILDEEQLYHFKTTQFRKDCSEIHLDITASVIDYFGDEAILSINRDETEARLAQEKIRLLSLGIEQYPYPIVITNVNAEIEYVNHAFEQVTQYTFNEVKGKNPNILQSADTPREVYKDLWDTLVSGKEWRGEFRNKKKDGTLYWELAVIFPLVDAKNVVKQYFASKIDITERKELEHQLNLYRERLEILVNERTQKLKESEETFRALSENSADVIMRFGPNIEHLYVNLATEKLFKRPVAQFIGKTYKDLELSSEMYALWELAIKKVFESGMGNQLELFLPNERYFDCRLYPEFDNNNKVVSVVTSSRDITFLKNTEKELVKKALLLRGVAEASNKLLSLDSFYKRITSALEIIGAATQADRVYIFENAPESGPGNIVMRHIYEWVSPGIVSQPQTGTKTLKNLNFNELGLDAEIEALKQGTAFTILVKNIPVPQRDLFVDQNVKSMLMMPIEIAGVSWGLVGFEECGYERIWDESEIAILKIIASDIGGAFTRKLVEDALLNSEERFKALFDFAPISYFIVDSDGIFIDVNNNLEKTLGYSKKEISSKIKIQNIIGSMEDKEVFEKVLADSHGGIPSNIAVVTMVHKNGKKMSMELNTFPITLGEKIMLLCAVHDVSLRIETENEIRTALMHSQELNEIKSRFVSMVSHEFRTPLSTILSSVEILKLFEARLKEEEKENHYRKITKSIDYLTNLLDDVITINRADSGRLMVKFKTVDLIPFIEQWILDIKSSFTESPEVIFEKHEKEIKVEIDENLLGQIFSNLLNNAIKYTPADKKITISVLTEDDKFKLRVADEGIGIPTDSQSDVFSPFYRAVNTGNVPGSGLGLAVAKRSVDILHGEISFVSRENKGTTFTVVIPRKRGKDEKNITN
jgi:PAS domain S-box-containing protein